MGIVVAGLIALVILKIIGYALLTAGVVVVGIFLWKKHTKG